MEHSQQGEAAIPLAFLLEPGGLSILHFVKRAGPRTGAWSRTMSCLDS